MNGEAAYNRLKKQYDKKLTEVKNLKDKVSEFESRKCSSCKKYSTCSYIGCIVGLQSKEELKDFCCNEYEDL